MLQVRFVTSTFSTSKSITKNFLQVRLLQKCGTANHYILRILESGLISRNTRNTEPPSQKCDYTIGSPLGFKNCITPFLVLIGGIGLALMSLAAEMSIKQLIGSRMSVKNPPEIETNEDEPKNNEMEPMPVPSNVEHYQN